MYVIDPAADGLRVPIKVWANDGDIEASCLDQARNLARLPITFRHVALMPDTHTGYGMPIGGVLATNGAVVPYAVGVDIGCGVRLYSTNLHRDDLVGGDDLSHVLDAIYAAVPVGNGPGGAHTDETWANVPADPWPSRVYDMRCSTAANEATESAIRQSGTLGGGNHFIEVQASDDGAVYVMLHSGSRSVGKKVCDHHYGIAKRLAEQFHVDLPDPYLAWLPTDSPQGVAYLQDMAYAMLWAERNRELMGIAVIRALEAEGATVELVTDIHHNYAAAERHHGRNVIVHRKGAVRARAGDTVLIPGSMGTGSYVGTGIGNPETFESCQHGAGRARGRKDTERMADASVTDHKASYRDREAWVQAQMVGVLIRTPSLAAVTDEAPLAYKDIEQVMAASADLVTPTTHLSPLGVVKG